MLPQATGSTRKLNETASSCVQEKGQALVTRASQLSLARGRGVEWDVGEMEE
jgi:hypothetical protein